MKSFADFLGIFNGESPKSSRSGEPWRPLEISFPNAQVFASFSGPDFCSTILREEKQGVWKYWLLGEVFGSQDLTQIEKLNGHFLLIGVHTESNGWHVWTNRLGTYHCYYATDGKRAALGTYFPAVAETVSRKKLDWEGLSGFFKFGFFPQDKTYFEDVKILRPATHYVFDQNGKKISESRYWEWQHEPNHSRSYDETVKRFGETLEQILDDQTASGQIALPISSGLDSRTVMAIMTQPSRSHKLKDRLWAYSYGYTDDSAETKIAERIAEARKIPFQRFTIRDYLFDRLDLNVKSVEGFQSVTSTRQAAITDEIATHADYLMAAHWGDVWMDAMISEECPPQRWRIRPPAKKVESEKWNEEEIVDYALHKIEKPGGDWLIENICKPQLGGRNPDEMLREMVREELNKLKHIKDPDFRIKAFKTDQWSFRWTCASLRMFQPGAFPRLPFYDNRMVDFCSTVPTNFVRGRRLQIDYLKKFHPDLAKITWDVTDSSLFHHQYYNSWLLPKRVLKKIGRIMTGKKHIGRNWEVQFLNEKGKAGLDRWLLQKDLKIHGFLSQGTIKALVDDVFSHPSGSNGYALSGALTLSTWLEKFA